MDARERGLDSLGHCGSQHGATAEPVAKALKDSNPKVRIAAARTIGKLDSHRAVDPLNEALGDYEQEVRKAAAESLEEIGEPLGRLIYDSLQGSQSAWPGWLR